MTRHARTATAALEDRLGVVGLFEVPARVVTAFVLGDVLLPWELTVGHKSATEHRSNPKRLGDRL